MTQILIKKILNKDKTSKAGKPYRQCSILTIDKNGQEVWLNSFSNSTTESWKDGQTVDLEIEKTDYGYKFKEPAERNIFTEIDKLNAKLDLFLSQTVKHTPPTPKTSPQAPNSPTVNPANGLIDKEQFMKDMQGLASEFNGSVVDDTPDFLK